MTIEFGDIEADDVFCADGEADFEQVAIRFHEDRALLANWFGDQVPMWHELDETEQAVALAIGTTVAEMLVNDQSTRTTAEWVHEVRVYFGESREHWMQLPQEERAVGMDLVRNLRRQLEREGTRR